MVTSMNFCRLCMSADPGDTDIFSEEEGIYPYQLEEMFQITLENNDEWPSVVCGNCISKLNEMDEFKRTILTTQDAIVKLFSATVKCVPLIEKPRMVPDQIKLEFTQVDFEEEILEEDIIIEEMEEEEETEIIIEYGDAVSVSDDSYSSNEESPSEEMYTEITSDSAPKTKKNETTVTDLIIPEESQEDIIDIEIMLTELQLLKCKKCSITFVTANEFEEHAKETHNERATITCCSQLYVGPENMYDHMRFHINPDVFQCTKCGRRFKNTRTLKRHYLRHINLPDFFPCEECDKHFKKEYDLVTHFYAAHVDKNDYKYECPHCGIKFPFNRRLAVHVQVVHDKKVVEVCEICGEGFINSEKLQQHIRRKHRPREPKECDVCGKYFLRVDRHKKYMHLEPKMVKCEVCGKDCTSKSLSQHMLMHTDQSFECDTCQKVFHKEVNLRLHIRHVHLGYRYKCHFCDHLSTDISNRKKHHKKMHPQELMAYREKRDNGLCWLESNEDL